MTGVQTCALPIFVQFQRWPVLIKDRGRLTGVIASRNVLCFFYHGILGCAVDDGDPSGRGIKPYFAFQILPVQLEHAVLDAVGGIVRQAISRVIAEQIAGGRVERSDGPEVVIVLLRIGGVGEVVLGDTTCEVVLEGVVLVLVVLVSWGVENLGVVNGEDT